MLCGATSAYNSAVNNPNSHLPQGLSFTIANRLRLQGFLYTDHNSMSTEFHNSMSKWISEGKINWKETIYDGLEAAPRAFVGLFKGENVGRTLVRIGAEI